MKTDKTFPDIPLENDAESSWTVENAMYILQHPTVDSKIWSEAVEWLLLYGPEEIKELLLSASDAATANCFPELKVLGYSDTGEPVYDIGELAKALDISLEEAQGILEKKLNSHGEQKNLTARGFTKIQ